MPVRFAVEFQKEHFVLLTIEILSFHLSLIIPPFIPLFAGSKTPPQNSAEAKKLGGGGLPVKARLVKANKSVGDEQNPTD